MKRWAMPVSVGLFSASLFFFYECVVFVARRDYVASIVLMFVGFAVMRGGSEMARLAIQRGVRK